MILILGDSDDTLLYFKARFSATLDKTYPFGEAYKGKIGTEDVVLCAAKESNYLSSLLTETLIKEYSPYLILNIGGVVSLDPRLKAGDVFIADRYYTFGLNYSGDGKSIACQIPGQPPFFASNTILNNSTEGFVYEATNLYVKRGFLLSGEERLIDNNDQKRILDNNYGSSVSFAASDNISWGLAMVAYLRKVTVLTIKIVGREINNLDQIITSKRTVLERMPLIGKVISRLVIMLEKE